MGFNSGFKGLTKQSRRQLIILAIPLSAFHAYQTILPSRFSLYSNQIICISWVSNTILWMWMV